MNVTSTFEGGFSHLPEFYVNFTISLCGVLMCLELSELLLRCLDFLLLTYLTYCYDNLSLFINYISARWCVAVLVIYFIMTDFNRSSRLGLTN